MWFLARACSDARPGIESRPLAAERRCSDSDHRDSSSLIKNTRRPATGRIAAYGSELVDSEAPRLRGRVTAARPIIASW